MNNIHLNTEISDIFCTFYRHVRIMLIRVYSQKLTW